MSVVPAQVKLECTFGLQSPLVEGFRPLQYTDMLIVNSDMSVNVFDFIRDIMTPNLIWRNNVSLKLTRLGENSVSLSEGQIKVNNPSSVTISGNSGVDVDFSKFVEIIKQLAIYELHEVILSSINREDNEYYLHFWNIRHPNVVSSSHPKSNDLCKLDDDEIQDRLRLMGNPEHISLEECRKMDYLEIMIRLAFSKVH